MKKTLLTIVLATLALSVTAQENAKKPSWRGFVSNGFWSNWELSAGAGVGTALSNGTTLGNFGDRLGFEANVSALKWFHPVVGGRLQLQGGNFKNVDPMLGSLTYPYLFVHTDLMINFSNWVGGYRDDRAYYLVPFGGFGYMATNFTDKSQRDNMSGTHQTFAFTYGLLNKFRISKCVDFNIELKGMLMPSRVSPVEMCGSYLSGFSATAGFTVRFNQRGWQRGAAGFTDADIRAMLDAIAVNEIALAEAIEKNERLEGVVDHAREDIARLKAQAKDAKAAAAAASAAAAAAENETCPSIIFYDINLAKLTPQERTRLELLAKRIKAGAPDKVYTIKGHADHQTGTPAFNERLSIKRARGVFDFLVGQGVNPKQLTYEGLGGKDNPFPIQRANRSAVVE